jgi:hypothetical protein
MSDLQTQPPPQPPPPRSSSENPSDDPLQKLHKMSRTAGLGSGDYAAVNGMSVAAVLFGVGSALVVLDAVFLLVPAVAIVLAIIALVQINRSAGTQTGRGLCLLAIILALACTAFLGSKQLMAYLEKQRNMDEVAAVVQNLGKDIAGQDYAAAHGRFSDDFRNRVAMEEFVSKFQQFQGYFGQIKQMRWNERIVFDVDNKTNEPLASTLAIIDLTNDKGTREEIRLRKAAGTWRIDDLPFLFPKPVKLVDGPGKGGPVAPRTP